MPLAGESDGRTDDLNVTNTTPTAENLSELHEPHWLSRAAFPAVSLGFFATQTALAVSVYRGWLWLIVPLILILSHFMHGMLIAFHEATHGLLRNTRRLNEVDGILIGFFCLMSFNLYRAAHQTHHAHFATERDEELWPFVHPRIPRWARMLAAFLELTLGLLYTPFLLLRCFLRRGSPIRSRKVRRRIWAELALIAAVWTCTLWAIARWNAWSYFLCMYFAPAYLAGNLQSWRKYIEHVGLTGSTIKSATRSIVPESRLGRFFAFTLLHEPYHCVHHQQVGLSHAELPQHASSLQPTAPDEHAPYRSYRHALADLICCLADPRVGPQWRTRT